MKTFEAPEKRIFINALIRNYVSNTRITFLPNTQKTAKEVSSELSRVESGRNIEIKKKSFFGCHLPNSRLKAAHKNDFYIFINTYIPQGSL